MDLAGTPLPAWLACAGWTLSLPIIAVTLVLAPWRRLAADTDAHPWCGGVVCLVALWHLQPAAVEGLHVHLLGVAAYALLVGPSLALAGCAVAVTASLLIEHGTWLNGGIAYAVLALVPVGVTVLVRHALNLWLRAPQFVRILLTAWTGGALSFAASEVLGRATAMPAVHEIVAPAAIEVFTVVACLASAEAMLTGVVLTLFFVSGRDLAPDT